MTKDELTNHIRKPDTKTERMASADDNADRTTMHYVKDCPYRFMQIPNPCDELPDSITCNTPDCWRLSTKMKGIDWTRISRKNITEFTETVNLVQPEVMHRLIDAYLAKQSSHD
jgi:hypothetical protein